MSGGVVAKRLLEAGLSVLCLEQGQWPDRADYPGSSPEWELRAAKQWSSSPGVRNGPADYPIDVTASEFGVLNFNGVGGGSILYNAQWPRMLPEDFAVRTRPFQRCGGNLLSGCPPVYPCVPGTAIRVDLL